MTWVKDSAGVYRWRGEPFPEPSRTELGKIPRFYAREWLPAATTGHQGAVDTLEQPQPALCGTYAAYLRHNRRGEPVDEACKAARREYVRTYKARRAAEAAIA